MEKKLIVGLVFLWGYYHKREMTMKREIERLKEQNRDLEKYVSDLLVEIYE